LHQADGTAPTRARSFTVMRSLRIREALALDGEFTAAGFTELRA
jgi:predicted nucleic acid-binding protein